MLAYLQIFADKEELLEPFDDAERGRLLTAMLAYALHDEEISLTGNERYIWPVFKQMINQSKDALDKKQAAGRARQQNGSTDQQDSAEASTRQQPPAPVSTSQQSTSTDQHNTAEGPINKESRIKNQESRDKNQDIEGDNARTRARFTPPTPMAVAEYALSAGLKLDPQRFCDFYASKGWKVGKETMKDWKAAVRNWCAREQERTNAPPAPQPRQTKTVREQQYNQREYEDTTTLPDWMQQRLKEQAR